ncbi:flagellin [Kushneria sinocarnis]|uniref:Flagellin n=1 Tax=Kushneria sinocarnis TaxID=595502 RepID=A0A420WY45_9GAMM|nr:flagellin [Kushneria sinocarnis]RKR06108.1 flagellin [Kushneria sinocarnis]
MSTLSFLSSLNTQQQLDKTQRSLKRSIERLSTGLRINSARDDAAGSAISNRMTSQIRGQQQAAANTNDGISVSGTAEGALSQINQRLQRIRELTVQGINGALNLTDQDTIQQEINLNLKEIDRLTSQSRFNGLNLLDGTAGTIDVQIGANDGETLGVDLNPPGFSVEELGLKDFTIAGVSGHVTPLNMVAGAAHQIPVVDPTTNLSFNGSSTSNPVLMESSTPGYGARYTRSQENGETVYYVSTLAAQPSHETASGRNSIAVDVGEQLYAPVEDVNSVQLDSATVVFEDQSGNSIENARLVATGNQYFIQQGTGSTAQFYSAAVTTDNPIVTARADSSSTMDPAMLTGLQPVTELDGQSLADADTELRYLDAEGNPLDADAVLTVDDSGHYYLEDDGNYYAVSAPSARSAQVTARATTATALDAPVFTESETVEGVSTITLDPANVTVDYTDRDGNYFADALRTDEEGQYYLRVAGGDANTPSYKTATLVESENMGTLLKTRNGTGDVILYYQFAQNANTDVPAEHSTVGLREVGGEIRLKTPDHPLAALDRAIARVDDKRSQLGATQNRMSSILDQQARDTTLLSQARSRIMDADYAVEVSNMTREQILQQAGTAVLAQANQSNQNVLSLLQ